MPLLLQEEIRDLLVTSPAQRSAISIRESSAGGVSLYGAVELDVRSVDQMARILEAGSLARATASTSMNSKSSRSHAIYTITVEQRRQVRVGKVNLHQPWRCRDWRGWYEQDTDTCMEAARGEYRGRGLMGLAAGCDVHWSDLHDCKYVLTLLSASGRMCAHAHFVGS